MQHPLRKRNLDLVFAQRAQNRPRLSVHGGKVVKIDGNPYSPATVIPQLPFDTPPQEAVAVDGAICPKGQAGVQTIYDPYRVRRVLKRAGARGSNKWRGESC